MVETSVGQEPSQDFPRLRAVASRRKGRGHEAVSLNSQDGWAVHAVSNVMEMQGRGDYDQAKAALTPESPVNRAWKKRADQLEGAAENS